MQCKLDAYQFQNANEHNDCVDFMQNSQTVVNLMRNVIQKSTTKKPTKQLDY